ncbi:MAG: hypothetical protein DI556_08210 [Rhodovulum sulfidophilum]|uniref:Autotransporter domain-containing protein n=1 Tax=Rhodovulum sulfidophilum TaxID=35806 RepID=A0A2W5NC19_RHOSU|nr:MAG: hypothetical protein DI556_08210 [Rhodovulum sulfidophilum]
MIVPTRARARFALLATTALASGLLLTLPDWAAAQSCVSTPPDTNCVIYVNPGQAGTDDTGQSLGDYEYNFSPPTAYSGDTNDAGLRVNLTGGAGGNASDHGDTGGTGGSVSSLTVGVSAGTPIEGSTPEGAINLVAAGGAGGGAMYGLDSMPTGASGGNGGVIAATLNGATTASDTSVAVSAQSFGGLGGAGHDGGVGEYAANGGSGGDARDVTISQGGSVGNSTVAGIYMLSEGGTGQNGGNDNAGILQQLGGDGGDGGGAGNVGYTLNGDQTLTAGGGYGVMAQSQGGDAGDGGYALDSHDKITGKDGGSGGAGGTAGTVTATIDGALTVTGTADTGLGAATGIGVLAQSFGGQGGSGGTTDAKIGGSGGGGAGSPGNTVTVQGSGAITTQGSTESPGVLAQSIGGGGGIAGNDTGGGLSVGGDGGNGADGGQIELPVGAAISTSGLRSGGIVAQSIGGGGGTAGSVTGSGVGLSYIIGGTGGAGGDGGAIDGDNSGVIQTSGAHSSALTLQSLGGGGGAGGAAMGQTSSEIFGATVSIGGDAGGGGDGAVIGTNAGTRFMNTGVLYTQGSDSHGILAQSVGGGGGVGGASMAETSVQSQDTDPPVPNLSLSVSVGGSGGSGGAGQNVFLGNSGFVMTGGEGASGLVAQSLSGGGGAGGDSKAQSTINGDAEFQMASSLTFGGSGGGGGAPGTADALNSGLIIATGESGAGMIAQTIGAGGGIGGSGDGSAKSKGDSTSATTEITLGGSAGNSGSGGTSNVTNSGGILTLGDAGYGMFAQSIGGGGGKGGGAAGTQNGGTLGFTLNIGGHGGNAGDGGDVTANNSGSIATFGADAAAIMVQSIGGSGGDGGKAGSTLGGRKSTGTGGNGDSQTGLASGLNLGLGDQTEGNGISPDASASQLSQKKDLTSLINMGFSLIGEGSTASGDTETDLGDLAEDSGDADDGSEVDSFSLSVAVGGGAGAGGSSVGVINVTNTGAIGTVGQTSEGIFAQSIGGGGGKGGAASSSTNSGDLNASFGVGGQGGASGSGGEVNVYNTGGSIITTGAMADGIVAQSVGGGGGKGGVAGSKTGLLDGLSIAIGGDGGANGGGGPVTVTTSTTGGAADGSILTQSHRSIGILAQSIGGGGGIVKTLSTDANNGGGADPTGDTFDLGMTFGGSGGAGGAGGTVAVTAGGAITTRGRDAHGILAQSIGGGGGLVTGASVTGSNFFGSGTMTGDSDTVSVTLTNAISTSGSGAYGVWAQSIGGGGGIAGDPGVINNAFGSFAGGGHVGDGQAIDITLSDGAGVKTTGDAATAIYAQSVGGGGGYVMSGSTAYDGTAGGSGTAADVTVELGLDGTPVTVSAAGDSAAAVWLQSQAAGGVGSTGVLTLKTGARTMVMGGTDWMGYGLVLDGGTNNVVTNAGTIGSLGNQAILENTPASNTTITNTTVSNTGMIIGDQRFANAARVRNLAGGTVRTHRVLDLAGGRLVNSGDVVVGVGATPRVTRMEGDLVQTARGALHFDADFVSGESDVLAVSGRAEIAGGVVVVPTRLVPGSVTVLTAAAGLVSDALTDATGARAFSFATSAAATGAGVALDVTPTAHFDQAGLSSDQRSIARHLQRIWDGDRPETMATGFGALAGVGTADYAATLDALASRQVGALATARMESSRGFVDDMRGCPVFQGSTLDIVETACAWGRVITGHLDNSREGFDADATRLEIGGQRRGADGIFLTGAFAYENASIGGDGVSASGDAWMLGGGIRYEAGPVTVSLIADLGYGDFDGSRGFAVGDRTYTAKGSPDARNAGLHGEVSYQMPLGGAYLRPLLGLEASWISLGGYTESGAGDFDLAVSGSDGWVFAAHPEVELGTRVDLADGTALRPFARMGASFVSGNDWEVEARFANAPGDAGRFTAGVDNPDALATVAAGISVMSTSNLDLQVQYQGGFADGYSAQSGALKLSWRF